VRVWQPYAEAVHSQVWGWTTALRERSQAHGEQRAVRAAVMGVVGEDGGQEHIQDQEKTTMQQRDRRRCGSSSSTKQASGFGQAEARKSQGTATASCL
jgi:hypothetical protein